jgi:hypothetical protein
MKRSELKQLIREVIEEISQARTIKAYAIVDAAALLNNSSLNNEQEIKIEAEATQFGEPKIYSVENVYAQDADGNNTQMLLFKKDQEIATKQISPKSLENLYDAIEHSFAQF